MAKPAKNEDDDDEKLTAVETGGEGVVVKVSSAAGADERDEDDDLKPSRKPAGKVVVKDTDEDEEDENRPSQRGAVEEDERAANREEQDEPEQQGAQHRERESQRDRRERQRRARERSEREMEFLRQRNETLEKRFSGVEQRMLRGEYQTLDERLANVENTIEGADDVIAKAIEAGAGDDAVKAQRIRDSLVEKRQHLKAQKQQIENTARQQNQRPPAPEVDPRAASYAQQWIQRNDWYDPSGKDEDSAIATAVDQHLAAEGFSPSTPVFWSELDKRLQKRLPHLYKQRQNGSSDETDGDGEQEERRDVRRSAPPRMPSAGRQPALKPGEVWVSPERRQAMMDAGLWEDPVLRNKTLKRYASYDREAREQLGR